MQDVPQLLLLVAVVLTVVAVYLVERRERRKGLVSGARPALLVRVGQVLMLREAVEGFPRGTAVRIVAAVGPAADQTYAVELYLPACGTREFYASGLRLTVSGATLAESLPEFRSGTTFS
jgi:hypothetical protein